MARWGGASANLYIYIYIYIYRERERESERGDLGHTFQSPKYELIKYELIISDGD